MDDRPCRGDATDRWLQSKLDAWIGGPDAAWHTLDDLIKDYRRHADTGTPLVQDVDTGPAERKPSYKMCPMHGWQPFCEVPGLTSEPTCVMCI